MMRVYEELGEDFYMWLTDCAFVHPDKTKAVEKIFKEEGYPYKIYKAEFTYFDGLQVNWYDFKSKNPKGIISINLCSQSCVCILVSTF